MLRKSFVVAGLFLASLAFVLDATATTAEACGGCGGCRRGCGYRGCCGGGYGGGYYGSSYGGYGCGGCGYSSGCAPACGTACCSTAVYVAPTCCSYGYPGSIYAPGYVSAPRQQYYVSPALPVSTYGLPVAMPMGSVLRTRPVLVSYSR